MDTAARQAQAFAEAFVSGQDWAGTDERLRAERTLEDFDDATRLAPDLRQMVA